MYVEIYVYCTVTFVSPADVCVTFAWKMWRENVISHYCEAAVRHLRQNTSWRVTTGDIAREAMTIGDNNVVSTASNTELVFLEMRIIKIEDNDITSRISSGADIAAITKENNYLLLVTDKFVPTYGDHR